MNRRASVTPADIAGCYRIQIGPWLPETALPSPSNVELTLENVPRAPTLPPPVRPSEYRVRLRDGLDPDFPRSRSWNLKGSSEAEIRWSSEGIAVKAQVTVDRRTRDLAGQVETVSGPHPNQSTASIRFVRRPC